MSVLRHEKEKEYNRLVMSLLESKYDGNILMYKQAENDVKEQLALIKKIKTTNNLIAKNEHNIKEMYTKFTYADLHNKTVSLDYIAGPEALLAYSLDYLSVKRIFPFSINNLMLDSKEKDVRKADTDDKRQKALDVFNWVQSRIVGTQFSLSNLYLDKKLGIFKYNTNMRDQNYGNVMQFITAKIDSKKEIRISGTNLRGNLLDLSHKYDQLFNYFILFGFTEFYARCNCPEYVRKYSKRNGIQNYFCSHILYSMAQLPYYLMYTLQ